jgi:hypothetical protein
MKRLIGFVLVLGFCAHAVSAQEQSAITPASTYNRAGVTVVSPNQSGWVVLPSSKSETVFEKRVKDEILTANVKTIKTKIFDNDKDLLMSLETMKQEELSKFKMESVHFNNVRFKRSSCVQYDGIFKVNGAVAAKFEYFNLKGYLCGHPETKGLAVQLEFSNHSNVRGFTGNLVDLSDEFFEGIVFSKVASK